MSREKNTDLTDCTDIGGAMRHRPPLSDKSEKSVIRKMLES